MLPKNCNSQLVAWASNHVSCIFSGYNEVCVNMKMGLYESDLDPYYHRNGLRFRC